MRSVAVLAYDGMSPFHLSVPCLVLGDRLGGERQYDVRVCAEQPGRLGTNAGFDLHVEQGLAAMENADVVILPSWEPNLEPSDALVEAIRSAHARGATVVGLCLGAFLVAASGIADGREVVTHWRWADQLAARYPGIDVRADVLWSDLGDLLTSAGTAASLDCCLHLLRTHHGLELAERVARTIVVAPYRSGSQAQYIPAPMPPDPADDVIERAMVWARSRLDQPVSLDEWAASVALSRRTFTRQFRARTGSSGQAWLLRQRLDRARLLLETTDHPVERVAAESGFGSSAALRHHFHLVFGTTPQRHRQEFAMPRDGRGLLGSEQQQERVQRRGREGDQQDPRHHLVAGLGAVQR
ncbi:transcriptional regulator GlxA family with amidase domain [Kribbella voronezhensis]|uniref:Transcriptional regulator GlxA family with amidase domain n=1 Tax=Kribbella voronezhensis TaxID=2512212 RepID=A0A4R7TBP0_9ACTN|nr:helix-turn-helix domain-containing protein [Kribbella voronezhensis]TDU88697.1 transcriptional regulator GlxA family with amidase domain [Kribbella voronezhensis]